MTTTESEAAPVTGNPRQPDPPVRLNRALVLALKWGASILTTEQLAARIGVDKSSLSRALRPDNPSAPSVRMLHGLAVLFPLAPYSELVVLADTPDTELAAAVGLTAALVDEGWELSDNPPT